MARRSSPTGAGSDTTEPVGQHLVQAWRVALDRDPTVTYADAVLLVLDERSQAERFHFAPNRHQSAALP